MEIQGVKREQIEKAVVAANVGYGYEGNIRIENLVPLNRLGTRWRIKLGVKDSRAVGGRRSASGRRVAALCWHGFRDVLGCLFTIAPDAVVKTAMSTYRGEADFWASFPETYYSNAGSAFEPAFYGDLCDHESDRVEV